MIPCHPRPKFVLFESVDIKYNDTKLDIVHAGHVCGVGRIIESAVDGVAAGDLIYFPVTHIQPVRLLAGRMHGLCHQDNLMAGASAGDLAEYQITPKSVPDVVQQIHRPQMGPSGLTI